jgi:putative toxin-antitoxin system antitoxin component (TIGR02293 family)
MYPVEVGEVVRRLGGERALGTRVKHLAQLDQAVARGLPRRVAAELVEWLAASRSERRALRALVVAEATYKRSARLPVAASERAERLARVIALAERALGSADEARGWLVEPHPLLEGRAPVEVARSDLGARRVERLLLNIEHGLPV